MKRITSIALFLALLTSLTACGEAASGSDTTAADSTDTTAPEVVDIYASLPTANNGGMEINILAYPASYGDSEYLDAEQTGEVIDDALFMRNSETEERLGVDIVFHTLGKSDLETATQFNSVVQAGDAAYDIFVNKSYALGSILSNGTIRPWDGIDGISYDAPWYIAQANETMTFRHKTYALFSDACGTNITMCWAYTFNKRIADEWQIGDLYSIVRDGKWTIDKVSELTKGVYQDLNGNSERDDADLYGFYTDKWATLDACMFAHDLGSISKDADDVIYLDYYSERLVNSIEKVYNLWWENSGTFVDTKEAYRNVAQFAQGHGLFTTMFIQYLIEGDMRQMEDEYGVLPSPKFDEAQENYGTNVHPRFGMMVLPVTLTAEKEAVIGQFTEVWSALSHKYLRPALYDVSLTTKGTRDEESIEMMDLIMDSRAFDFSTSFQSAGGFPFTQSSYKSMIAKKNKDVASYYESNREKAETFITNMVEKLSDAVS
ncbi:MAG: hypothetical protein E7632_00955 [Ruminococcaceae bacterium]|nr:hypothetical protein [Oscillospiraceae bacterium]